MLSLFLQTAYYKNICWLLFLSGIRRIYQQFVFSVCLISARLWRVLLKSWRRTVRTGSPMNPSLHHDQDRYWNLYWSIFAHPQLPCYLRQLQFLFYWLYSCHPVFEQWLQGERLRLLPKASWQSIDLCERPPPNGEQCNCSTVAGTQGHQVHQAGSDPYRSGRWEERSSAAPWHRWGEADCRQHVILTDSE